MIRRPDVVVVAARIVVVVVARAVVDVARSVVEVVAARIVVVVVARTVVVVEPETLAPPPLGQPPPGAGIRSSSWSPCPLRLLASTVIVTYGFVAELVA